MGMRERRPQPLPDARVQRHLGKRARPAHVVVDGDEQSARPQVADVVGQHVDGIGQMHQQQPADNGIERLVIGEGACVAIAEDDIAHTGLGEALLGGGQLRGVSLDADHESVEPDHLGHLESDVAGPRPQVENPHAWTDAAALEEKSCRFGHHRGLRLQPGDLSLVAAKDVFGGVHTSRQRHCGHELCQRRRPRRSISER